MSIKPVTGFSPTLSPHADWIDKNVGNKDGNLSADELGAYKAKFPDATMYEPQKSELLANTTGAATNVVTTARFCQPVAVGQGVGVLGFRLGQTGTPAKVAMPPSCVKCHLPVDLLTQLGASAAGEVFHQDSGEVATMAVRVKQVVDPVHGRGTEFTTRLTTTRSMDVTLGFGSKQIPGGEAPFTLEKASFKDGATALEKDGAYAPQVQGANYGRAPLMAFKVELKGKFSVEYIPPRENPQAYRDKLRVRVFGQTDAERKVNLEAAVNAIRMPELIADADPLQSQRMVRFSVLRMLAPARAEELASSKLKEISLPELDAELAKVGVDVNRLQKVGVQEVFPGHMAAVDPALGDTYSQLGVRAVMVGVREVAAVVGILSSDGLMSSMERYGRGLHKAGASLTSDEASGGAEFAFTRLITQKAMDSGVDISRSFGAGSVQLISVGDPMKGLLSRTDWHAYANDSFGTTVARTQAEGPNADAVAKAEYAKRPSKFTDRAVLGDLVSSVDGAKVGPTAAFQHNNEACFKTGVPASTFTHAVVKDEATRKQLVDALKAAGITQLGGTPVDSAVILASNWKQVGQQLGMAPP